MPQFLIHYGELGLKGKNRRDFEQRLKVNILNRIKKDDKTTSLEIRHKYLVLNTKSKDAAEVLSKTFGIKWFAQVTSLNRKVELEEIASAIVNLAKAEASAATTFRVSCKRADKSYPQQSPEIERKIGEVILDKTDYKKVSLSKPDNTYYIEINTDEIFIYSNRQEGPGGLPVGSSGRVLVLLSGGIDSPVAAYQMAKRGCQIDFLNFYVMKPKADDKIVRLAKLVAEYSGSTRLYLAPYAYFSTEVLNIGTEYELVLFRRFMLKLAEKICKENKLQAIVTGDNLGQVASQTLANLAATEDALTDIPCFRPLISFDKEEIISIAKKIDTFETSNEPHKDCCSLIDRHAKTRVRIEKIREEEKLIKDYEKLLETTIGQVDFVDIP